MQAGAARLRNLAQKSVGLARSTSFKICRIVRFQGRSHAHPGYCAPVGRRLEHVRRESNVGSGSRQRSAAWTWRSQRRVPGSGPERCASIGRVLPGRAAQAIRVRRNRYREATCELVPQRTCVYAQWPWRLWVASPAPELACSPARNVHPQTGGVIIFEPDGRFYYSFTTSTKGLPRNLGHYHFESATDTTPGLQVRSAHNHLFSIRVSESDDRVFLTHPQIFDGEQVYQRQ